MSSLIFRISFFILLFCLISCNSSTQADQDKKPPLPVQDFITLEDGNRMFYRKQGTGQISLVFVHGWCIDGNYFQSQMGHLDKQYQLVSVDLIGHGKSDADRQKWTMQQYGKDIAQLVESLQLQEVILIGHSMSEVIVAEAAALLGDKVKAIIGIDTYINPIEQVKAEDSLNIVSSMRADFSGTLHAWMGSYFPENTDSSVKNFILQDMAEGPADICVSIMEELIHYQNQGKFPALLASLTIPIRTINVIPPDSAAWAEIKADFDWIPLQNTGHYPMVEVAGQLNAALSQTLTAVLSRQ